MINHYSSVMLDKQIAFLTTAAAAFAAGVYVFWGPSSKKNPKRKDFCPGLENLGNTCFLNSVLQALASCSSVTRWLEEFLQRQGSDTVKDSLAQTVVRTLKVLNNESEFEEHTYSPGGVIHSLRARHWVISPDEQDAHEMFNVLTQTLDEETMKYPRVISLFDLGSLQNPVNKYQPKAEAVTRCRGLLPILPHKEAEHPFRGLLASQLQCKECGYKFPVRYDLFDSLSLSIPNSMWGVMNLDMLLQHFVTAETVSNVECPGCAKAAGIDLIEGKPLPKRTFRKRLTIGKLPQCLCIHIKRTQWLNNGLPMKRFEHISFPEDLHMDDYMYSASNKNGFGKPGLLGGKEQLFLGYNSSGTGMKTSTSGPVNLLRALNYDNRITMNGLFLQPPSSLTATTVDSDVNHNGPELPKYNQTDYTYKLTAALQHLGDVFSGHFVTYRRSPFIPDGDRYSERWLYTSDTTVKRATLQDVLSMEAYMLFYERV